MAFDFTKRYNVIGEAVSPGVKRIGKVVGYGLAGTAGLGATAYVLKKGSEAVDTVGKFALDTAGLTTQEAAKVATAKAAADAKIIGATEAKNEMAKKATEAAKTSSGTTASNTAVADTTSTAHHVGAAGQNITGDVAEAGKGAIQHISDFAHQNPTASAIGGTLLAAAIMRRRKQNQNQ